MLILDESFDLIKKNKTIRQENVSEKVWANLLLLVKRQTVFSINGKEFSLRFLQTKIEIIDVEKYRKQKKIEMQNENWEPIEKKEKEKEKELTQDDSRDKRRFATFW